MVDPYQPPSAQLGASSADGSLSDGHYEFSDRENAVIGRTAKLARAWGIIALASGVLLLLILVGGLGATVVFADQINDGQAVVILIIALVAALLPLSLVNLATGWYYVGTGKAFQEVVETTGDDIALLMTGLNRTTKAFQVELIFLIVGVVLGIGLQVVTAVLDASGQGG